MFQPLAPQHCWGEQEGGEGGQDDGRAGGVGAGGNGGGRERRTLSNADNFSRSTNVKNQVFLISRDNQLSYKESLKLLAFSGTLNSPWRFQGHEICVDPFGVSRSLELGSKS